MIGERGRNMPATVWRINIDSKFNTTSNETRITWTLRMENRGIPPPRTSYQLTGLGLGLLVNHLAVSSGQCYLITHIFHHPYTCQPLPGIPIIGKAINHSNSCSTSDIMIRTIPWSVVCTSTCSGKIFIMALECKICT